MAQLARHTFAYEKRFASFDVMQRMLHHGYRDMRSGCRKSCGSGWSLVVVFALVSLFATSSIGQYPATNAPRIHPSTSAAPIHPSMRTPEGAPRFLPYTNAAPINPTASTPRIHPSTKPSPTAPTIHPSTNAPRIRPSTKAATIYATTGAPRIHPTTGAPPIHPSTNAPAIRPTTNVAPVHPTTNAPRIHPSTNAPPILPSTKAPPIQQRTAGFNRQVAGDDRNPPDVRIASPIREELLPPEFKAPQLTSPLVEPDNAFDAQNTLDDLLPNRFDYPTTSHSPIELPIDSSVELPAESPLDLPTATTTPITAPLELPGKFSEEVPVEFPFRNTDAISDGFNTEQTPAFPSTDTPALTPNTTAVPDNAPLFTAPSNSLPPVAPTDQDSLPFISLPMSPSTPELSGPLPPLTLPSTTPLTNPPTTPTMAPVGPIQPPLGTPAVNPLETPSALAPLDAPPALDEPSLDDSSIPSSTPPNPLPTTSPSPPEEAKSPTATTTPTADDKEESSDDVAYEDFGFDCGSGHGFFDKSAFSPDPSYDHIPYNSVPELGVYEGKWNMCSQRPLIELGRGMYRNGVVPRSYSFLGKKNLITPSLNVYGDFRTAVAINDNGVGDPKFVWANRLNLDFDVRLTATERIHAFWGPLDEDGRFTRVESFTDGRNELRFSQEFDDDFDTLFFEGDLGYIWGGMTDQWAPFDLPFVVGKFPLLFQNGVWINDAVEGFAFTPALAQHSRVLNWSNFDLTFFFLFDDIDSRAFGFDDNAADAYGFNWFLEAFGGYTELGYAYLEDRANLGRSYHNMTIGFTRRYGQRISNSVRVIVNSGQDPDDGVRTADGQLLLIENSLVSSNPTFFVPYFNFFAGFGTPNNIAGQSVLQNVGINFETDALTGYPKLDDLGHDTWGGAFGFNLLGPNFAWQWILEAAMVQEFSDRLNGDQYAVGTRIQRSINYAWLVRFDAMYGLRENESDISGVRAELRWKF